MHNVPKGSESHFRVVVVSEWFENISALKRHQLVNKTLAEEFKHFHALSLETYTPKQWELLGGETHLKSPNCKGGSKLNKSIETIQQKKNCTYFVYDPQPVCFCFDFCHQSPFFPQQLCAKLVNFITFFEFSNISDSEMDLFPARDTFICLRNQDFDNLSRLSIQQIRIVLPSLVRMCLCSNHDDSLNAKQFKTQLWRILSLFNEVDDFQILINELQNPDYIGKLDVIVRREEKLRSKGQQVSKNDSCFFENDKKILDNVVESFERGNYCRKLEIVIYELLILLSQKRFNFNSTVSELFDSIARFDEVVDCLYFAISEFPLIFNLGEVIEALLLCKNRLILITRLLTNFPESLSEICQILLHNASDKPEDDNQLSLARFTTLRELCRLNIEEALFLRWEALELCRMPNLIIQITLDSMHFLPEMNPMDLTGFLTGVLLSSSEKTKSWFAAYIKHSPKHMNGLSIVHPFQNLRTVLLRTFHQIISQIEANKSTATNSDSEKLLTNACALMRLYCALRCIGSMKFSDEEVATIFKVVQCRPLHSYTAVRFVSYALCLIFVCLQHVAGETEVKIGEWIQWLSQEESYLAKDAGNKSSFGELLLLISIHFHSNNTLQISELLSSIIFIKLPILANHLNRVKGIFGSELFNYQNVALKAVKVPVTKMLNSSTSGTLPVHCIFHLLKNQIFSKNNVDIENWIYLQLCNTTAPIHPILPLLITSYVDTIFKNDGNRPISQEKILIVFQHRIYSIENCDDTDIEDEGDDDINDGKDVAKSNKSHNVECYLTTQLLLLYYLLLYQDCHLKRSETKADIWYDNRLWNNLPIKYLVDKMRSNQNEYGALMPKIVNLLFNNYRYLCMVKDWFPQHKNDSECVYEFSIISTANGKKYQMKSDLQSNNNNELENLKMSFKKEDSLLINSVFERILKLPDEFLWPLVEVFVFNLPVLLKISPKINFINARAIWFRLNSIFPTKLWKMTLWAFRSKTVFMGENYNENNVQLEQLVKITFDYSVFKIVEFIDIYLHIFNGCIQFAKSKHEKIVRIENKISNFDPAKSLYNPNMANLTGQLEILSSIYKIKELLDRAVIVDSDCPAERWNAREIQSLIFKSLHQMFIEDANICKFLHHFGYRRELLPAMVAGIPSMHICSEQIFDLVQSDNDKKIFAFDLFSHLCHHYPVDRFFSIASKLFDIVRKFFDDVNEELLYEFLLPIIPSLQRMCRTFPYFSKNLVKILLRTVEEENMNRIDEALIRFFGEEKIITMNWYVFEKFCNKQFTDPRHKLDLTVHKALGMLAEAGQLNQIHHLEFVEPDSKLSFLADEL